MKHSSQTEERQNSRHDSIELKSIDSKPHRIVWGISIIGLGTGVLILGAIFWSLEHIQENRVLGDQISATVATAISRADEYFSSTLALTSKLLEDDAVVNETPTDNVEVPSTSAKNNKIFSGVSSSLMQQSDEKLQQALNQLKELNQRCFNYKQEVDDVNAAATESKERVDDLLRKLRSVLDDNEGRELLSLAIQISRYRQLPHEERNKFAVTILDDWSPQTNGSALKMELADLALLCQKLSVERNADNLSDFRENRLQPIFSRMERLLGTGSSVEVGQPRALLSELEQAMFAVVQSPHQNEIRQPGSQAAPLFEACSALLRKRDQKKDYESQLRQCIAQYNSARSHYLDTFDHVSRESTRDAVKFLEATSFKVSIVGIGLSAVFVFFAVRASRLIQSQFHSIQETTEKLAEKTTALQASKEYLELVSLVAKHTDNLVLITNEKAKIIWANDGFTRVTGYGFEELVGKSSLGFLDGPETDPNCFEEMKAAFDNRRGFDIETIHYRKNGKPFWVSIEARPVMHQTDSKYRYVIIKKDITARIEAEKEQHRLTELLMDASRRAGFAELATGVLHNVGNVLNSVNVSASAIQTVMRKSALTTLERLCNVIGNQTDGFADFVANDPRGQHIPNLLVSLNNKLSNEHDQCLSEFDSLLTNIEHIKAIISVQQTTAKARGVMQNLRADELVNDSIAANKGRLLNYGIAITANVSPRLPEIVSDKHRILQILVNLIGNAKDSLVEAQTEEPRILVQAETTDDGVFFEVMDNGKGIEPDVLQKIFQHGFTTKKTGHGFGLHSSANAAAEIGGSLSAFSEGRGHGATFRLFIPLKPPADDSSPTDWPQKIEYQLT